MNKTILQTPNIESERAPLQEAFTEFFSKWGKWIFYGVLSLSFLLFVYYRFFLTHPQEEMMPFLEAKTAFAKLERGEEENVSLEHLREILQKTPRLQVYYDRVLVNQLSYRDRWDELKPFAKSCFQRCVSNDPYKLYSEASLLIGAKKFEEALRATLELDKVIQDKATYSLLYGFNLLRRASLYRELKNNELESQAWGLWKVYVDDKKNQESVEKIMKVFQEGEYRFEDYIKISSK